MRRAIAPVVVGTVLALLPAPAGLAPNAWHYFALFAAVITGVITEPLPGAAVGLAGVVLAAVLGMVGNSAAAARNWALSGFSNGTVWLVFAAYTFTLGYARTGLGKRTALHLIRRMGRRTLGLAYAITLADLCLAPFTPSATARTGGTIYPIIHNVPELFGSRPDDGTAGRMGGYLLYTALAVSMITSSMFITALAPNVLAISLIENAIGVTISWTEWARGFAPVGLVLLLVTPAFLYVVYPPEIKEAPEAPRWAAAQLDAMGPITREEWTLLVLVAGALAMWVGAAAYIDPAIVAMLVVVLMIVLGIVTWSDVLGYGQAWNILIWFATLVTLAGGLSDTGFIEWLANATAPLLTGLSLYPTMIALVLVFYLLHYCFASITAHTVALLPVFLAIAVDIPGLSPTGWALFIAFPLGLMGILTSYGSGQSAVYYGSGYISRRAFWTLGFVLGIVFVAVYLVIIIPWLAFLGV